MRIYVSYLCFWFAVALISTHSWNSKLSSFAFAANICLLVLNVQGLKEPLYTYFSPSSLTVSPTAFPFCCCLPINYYYYYYLKPCGVLSGGLTTQHIQTAMRMHLKEHGQSFSEIWIQNTDQCDSSPMQRCAPLIKDSGFKGLYCLNKNASRMSIFLSYFITDP